MDDGLGVHVINIDKSPGLIAHLWVWACVQFGEERAYNLNQTEKV